MSKDNSVRYRLFASYYLGEAQFNATRAAELAGYTAKNRASLISLASQILHHPQVQQIITAKVEEVEMTNAEILEELAALARWQWKHEIQMAKNAEGMAPAKVFDTMMRGKLKALSDLQKINMGGLKDQIEKLRAAFEQHQQKHPEISDDERAAMFKEHVEPTLVDQLLAELLKRKENQLRLREAEADVADPMEEG